MTNDSPKRSEKTDDHAAVRADVNVRQATASALRAPNPPKRPRQLLASESFVLQYSSTT